MSNNPVVEIAGIAALLPLTVVGLKGQLRAEGLTWVLLAAAVVGGSLPAADVVSSGWSSSLGPALDVSVAVLLVMFGIATLFLHGAIRLAGLVGPYALLLLVLGWIIGALEPQFAGAAPTSTWFSGHVLFAVASYGALTLAALAAISVLLLERAFKARAESWAGRALPPLDQSEATQNGMLKAATILMLLALATGAANEYLTAGHFLAFTHKILLSVLAFLVLVLVLFLHHRSGMRGRRAARWLLAGFLLLTLAYPGVKFVREFLIA